MMEKQKTPIALAIEELKVKKDMWQKSTKQHSDIRGTYTIAIMVLESLKPKEREMFVDAGNSCAVKQYLYNSKTEKMSIDELMEEANKQTVTFGEEYFETNLTQE